MTVDKFSFKKLWLTKVIGVTTAFVMLLGGIGVEGAVYAADTKTGKGAPAPSTPPAPKIVRYTGEMSKAVSMVYTAKPELALTFNGLGDEKKLNQLLTDLDTYKIKATFFLPGDKVAKQPQLAKLIVAKGHEIENNAVTGKDLANLSYEQIYQQIKESKEQIVKHTGITPKYVRTWVGTYTDDIRLAAAHNGQEAVIGYSFFLHNWQDETDEQKSKYVRRYINRGGIITLDLDENIHLPISIPLIAKGAANAGYQFVPLQTLIAHGAEKKPLTAIEGYDAAKINPDFSGAKYKAFKRVENAEKKVAITLDDWGSDETVTKILNILDKYHVKSTFFLRADGTVKNPNLARAILEAGHDVANHSYSHPINTQITTEQLQQEIVKAHQIITEAIQQKPTMYYRPPAGAVNEQVLKAIAATGYETVALFDVIPSDHDKSKTADDIVKTVLGQTKSGSIILLHMLDDISTVEALPRIIEGLQEQGYTLVKMTELVEQSE
ncbi:polysaccharide deacetylase family protein [Brevibacillus reuszeri]|uniref:polysaccharide deacetylase family protein n=1 Tax=Brevibacillus reuszeri TaxID=54915 RepID=UPI00289E5C57|nr:polysaccharide deacetylase family protein [Brevibacillus reuszeri]